MIYDWTWRKRARETDGVMTFDRIKHEAVEICSSALYLRRGYALAFVSAAYMHGGLQKNDIAIWRRRIEQAFVRAYLIERRIGIQPRDPGPPTGSDIVYNEAQEDAKRSSERERNTMSLNKDYDFSTVTGIPSEASATALVSKNFDVESAQAAADEALSYLLGHTFEHYKGGYYRVLSTAVDEATGKVLVIYYSEVMSYRWVRTLENFTENVIVDGRSVPRFKELP